MRQTAFWPIPALLFLACGASAAPEYARLKPGVWFLRVTNPADSGAALCTRVYFNPNRLPWTGDTIYLAQGGERPEVPAKEEWLAPGASSDWVDISPHMSASPTFGSGEYLSPVFLGAMYEPAATKLRLQVELALGPEKRLVRRLDLADPNPTLIGYAVWFANPPRLPTLGLLIPVDPTRSRRIWTLEEAAEQQLQWIDSFGPTPKAPRYLHFICHQSWLALKNPTRLERLQAEIVRRLGYGNLTQFARDGEEIEALRQMGVEPQRAIIAHHSDDLAGQARKLKEAGLWEYVRLVNFGDEIDIKLTTPPAEQDAAFVAYLKEKGLDPLDFVRPEDELAARALPPAEQWRYVRLGGPLPPDKPKLLYESGTFRYRLWARELAEQTRIVEAVFPPGTVTGANFSPHLSVWPDARKWIHLFRDGGMSMPWSEDWWWQVPEASPQSYGYLLTALRHAADYHQAPYCFYTIPDPGESAEHLLRMNYFALGHQAKMIDHFAIYHQAYATCDYIDFLESRDSFRSIHRILSAASQVDERLYRARMRRAEVAILIPSASDVWNTEDLLTSTEPEKANSLYWAQQNVDNHERKALWLALRHAHFPVDVVTDEDVAAGGLAGYKVVYLVGQEIVAAAVPALVEWVRGGGTLIGSGGGGLLNEYREPLPAMSALYGVARAELQRPVRSLGPSTDLPKMQPLDTITVTGLPGVARTTLPVYCYRQTLQPDAEGTVLGTYSDGSPALVGREWGAGRALLAGGLAGLAYLQPSQVNRRDMPEQFPRALRALITAPAQSAGVARHVVTSDPLVEATLQEGPLGAIVTLISFRNQPQRAVTVGLPGLPAARSVRSIQHGRLEVTRTKAGPTVRLPVDQGDFLVVD